MSRWININDATPVAPPPPNQANPNRSTTMLVLIESADKEIISVRAFQDFDAKFAHETFEKICAENKLLEEWDVSDGCKGTVRLAGDDGCAVQLIETAPE